MKKVNFEDLLELAAESPHLFQKKYQSHKEVFLIKGLWGENVFHFLCVEGYVESVKIMIEMGADVNSPNAYGETPLAICSFIEQKEIVAILLKAGADPNRKNQYGQTALHHAYSNSRDSIKKSQIIFLLLSYGADPGLKDNWGFVPSES